MADFWFWGWLALAGLWAGWRARVVWRARDSRRLDEYPVTAPADAPLVTVIIPARNEARNIERCLGSVLASTYPRLEVLVVDDHSTDETAAIAHRLIAADAALHGGVPRARVLSAPPLPPGWFGKQWACHTAAHEARGELLCFTDADTWHGPELLARAVNAQRTRGAALFSVIPRQEMHSFWEKVIQPFMFFIVLSHYGGMEEVSRTTDPTYKLANGQFLLFTRESYEHANGHFAVRGFVGEDTQLAQRFTRLGLPVHMVLADGHMMTRMYASFAEIRKGWGKNAYASAKDALPLNAVTVRLLPWVFPLSPLSALVPLIALALGLLGVLGSGALWFGAVATLLDLLFWLAVYRTARVHPLWGLTWPLAGLVLGGIFAEAAWRGSRVQWKGREYVSGSPG